MLDHLAKTIAWYGVGGYAIALFCAMPYFDRPASLDDPWARRMLRRADLLAIAGPLHPVVALTALGIARDVDRLAEAPELLAGRRRRTTATAYASLAASVAIAAALFSGVPAG